MVQKYGTKIYVLVPGPIIKENWKEELLKCTHETYLKQQDMTTYINEEEKEKMKKMALSNALQYYRFMTYRSFYKKVLGERISEKEVKTGDDKVKKVYRKTEEGEFERDVAIDRIYNLNNSLLIVDEAHNITGNEYGDAVMKVIKNSINLKVVLLTATPMKNLAHDCVQLINFLRPSNDPILRDKIFTSLQNYEMEIKPGGIDYFKDMVRGYVSYLRGADPLTFAKRVDKGETGKGLMFTKITSCNMLEFQRHVYDEVIKLTGKQENEEDEEKTGLDSLDRKSQAVANIAFPGLNDKKELVGYYGREGINTVKNQLKTNPDLINKKVALEILKDKSLESDTSLVQVSENGKTISGKIFRMEYLKYFSIKFYKALKKINRLVWGKKGARTAFIYSNLVKSGIELFQEVLLMNGYLEYDEKPENYKIKPTTRCYFCGKTFEEHQSSLKGENKIESRPKNVSESSTEYEKPKDNQVPEHQFKPSTFVVVTGASSEESGEIIPEEKQYILRHVFSTIDNIDGKNIKFVLGSRVMNEGISLKYVSEVHILDVYYNLGKVDQVIGRAIRHRSHDQLMSKDNPFPEVNVYKYAVTLDKGVSSEEELYKKAELKYLLIKKIERAMKEMAIDCALNMSGNIYPEEVKEFKGCVEPDKAKKGDHICSYLCDYTNCEFKCDSKLLNNKYFDENNHMYKSLTKTDLDRSTFTQHLARNEIENVKSKIKELFRMDYIHTLKDILNYVKNSYSGEKKELFEDIFVYEALNELTPITENDFNNFKDTVYDKYNRQGYLIYIDKYYIYQPFDQPENIPMYYRINVDKTIQTSLSLYNYLKSVDKLPEKEQPEMTTETETERISGIYDFDSVMEYYENREEFKYVGIIDKEPSRRKIKSPEELADVFKLRERRGKILKKLRGTGVFSMFGSVCHTSRSLQQLKKIAQDIGAKVDKADSRMDLCGKIKDKLLLLEKYSTGKDKMTYMIIPANHSKYRFPYNLQDFCEHIKSSLADKIKFKLDINIKTHKQKVENESVSTYEIELLHTKNLDEFKDFIQGLGFKLIGKKWLFIVD